MKGKPPGSTLLLYYFSRTVVYYLVKNHTNRYAIPSFFRFIWCANALVI